MKTILLVDDTELNRKFMIPVFASNYTVLEADSGPAALALLKTQRVDLVITDIFMEPMDGYSLIAEIRKSALGAGLPIVAVTEKDAASQAKAIEAGADYFISRPMQSDLLRKVVHRLTGQDAGRLDLIRREFLLDSVPGAILVYKQKDGFLEIQACSRGIGGLLGWEADEFIRQLSQKDGEKLNAEDTAHFVEAIDRILATKSRAECIFRGYRKDGSLIWLWMQGQYLGLDTDGLPLIETLVMDITNNSNVYRYLLDKTEALVTVVDADTFEVLYANSVAREFEAKNAAQGGAYLGSVCYRHMFGLEAPCSNCIVNNSKAEHYVSPNLEHRGRWYRQVYQRVNWYDKNAIVEYVYDVTEQQQSIQLIEKQKRLQEEILDTIPAGIMVFKFTEAGARIVSANRSICEMMELEREKAVGQDGLSITMLTHPDDIAVVREAAERLSVSGASVEYEYRSFCRIRREYIWVLGQGRSIRQADGNVYAYVNFTDISARKELENMRLQLESTRSEAAIQADFYSRMSHDMRTPMNGILGIAELALQENDVDTLHSDIKKMQESGNYMLGLINDTLDLQRMESGRLKLEPQLVRCSDVLQEVVVMLTPALREKKIDFKVKILENSEMDWYVRIDPMRLKQIGINLLSNAVKFTPEGGAIELCVGELARDGMISHTLIRISDSGLGMSQAFLESGIFKPFCQERNEYSMKYPGSGLGLSIVKQLVELMGGRIEVTSELGAGTSFSVYLDFPMVTDEEAKRETGSHRTEVQRNEQHLAGRAVLLCEDHPLNAEIVQRLLKKAGCTVDWAKNGQQGVEFFMKSQPGSYATILMDIRMPVLDGLQATRVIRAMGEARPDAKTIPIIAMSANAYAEDIQKSLDAGMNRHLAKPVAPAAMYQAIAEAIRDR